MTGWQMNRGKKIKAAFVKTLRGCCVITIIIIIVKWLLHFSFVLADRCGVPMVTTGSPAKELSSCIRWWTPDMTVGSTNEVVHSCTQVSPGACRSAQ